MKTIFATLLCVFVVIIFVGYKAFLPTQLPNHIPYQLMIESGMSVDTVINKLADDSVIKSRKIMKFIMVITGKDKNMIAGLYMLKQSLSIFNIINRITNGHPDAISITILEGWSLHELRSYIDGLENINHLTEKISDIELLKLLKINYNSLEGVFYPNTYFIVPQQSDISIYEMSYRIMQNKINQAWINRHSNVHYKNSYQLLILASLIQKETANVNDMYKISAVFNNRLSMNMRLQDDPAVFFGLHKIGIDKITRPDFNIDTAYNTYLHNGLPPTPICIPSQHAIDAATYPSDDNDLLFFIAVGGGKSKFSTNFKDHLSIQSKLNKSGIKH